jgi:hypothetical protein
MATPSGGYVPPHKRPGASAETLRGTPMVIKIPAYETYLKSSSWTPGAGANWYYPSTHPHVHLFRTRTGWNMAYSEGKQHLGGRGVTMVSGGGKLKNYAWAIGKLETHYGEEFNKNVVNNCYTAMQNW